MSEENKNVVRRYMQEIWNEGQLDRFYELISPDVVTHTGPPVTDANSMKRSMADIRNAFPDLHIALDDELAAGDKVVTRFTISGTQQGELRGLPVTGRQAVWSGITIWRLADGKIAEFWTQVDNMGMMQQLGVIPAPDGAGD